MPTDACQYFYICENCGTRLKPKEGDCSVFIAAMVLKNVHLYKWRFPAVLR